MRAYQKAGVQFRTYIKLFHATTGLPVTGEAANFTKKLAKDGANVASTGVAVAEVDSVNQAGVYYVTWTPGALLADYGTYRVEIQHPTHNTEGFEETIEVNEWGLPGDPVGAVLDKTQTIDGYSVREILRILAAANAGKGQGSSAAPYRAIDDSKARITATTTSDGNRTAVTVDAS